MKKRIKNKKGFTLIELLAVIVILGLLMAIAIPSVTKYITQSRKKTVVSTINNYIGAMVNDINDLTYTFTESNTIYAVPIECIALERGGTSPLGKWHQANKEYWAYVLVQYDDVNSSYTYGFTFKDSSGYGLYPTTQDKLNTQGKQIKTGLNLKRPRNDYVDRIIPKNNWDGFNLNGNTKLRTLSASLEGEVGDNKNTCTLVQKAPNYQQVQAEINDTTLMVTDSDNIEKFWGYKEQIKNIIFEDEINIPTDAHEFWDVSLTNNGKVIAYIIQNQNDTNFYDLYIQCDGIIYANENSSHLFSYFKNVESIKNINLLNTEKTTNMQSMFRGMTNLKELDITNFNTQNVTSMRSMFRDSTSLIEIDLTNFITGNVKDMGAMFAGMSNLKSLDVSSFDTSKVTNMHGMFSNLTALDTLNLGNFNTKKVTNMGSMFYNNKISKLDVSNLDTSNVILMDSMFQYCTNLTELDVSKFNTRNVESMYGMFAQTTKLKTLDLSNFDTTNVINMGNMFAYDINLKNLIFNKAEFNTVTGFKGIFTNVSSDITVIVKNENAKKWIQDKIGAGKGNIVIG